MPCYFVVTATTTDPDGLARFNSQVGPTVARYGGSVVVVTDAAEVIEGVAGPRLVILEFADRSAFDRWYRSPEYQAIIGLRLASTTGFAVVAERAPAGP